MPDHKKNEVNLPDQKKSRVSMSDQKTSNENKLLSSRQEKIPIFNNYKYGRQYFDSEETNKNTGEVL